MNIVIIGLGKIGKSILSHIAKEGHDLCIIDNNSEVVNELVDQYDILGVSGNGASIDIQTKADVEKSDVVVACTSNDEVNLLACLIAKKVGAKHTIARIRNHDYFNQINFMKNDLGLSMIINPEQEAANEIAKIIDFPIANRIETFARGKVDLMELSIEENNPIVGMSLSQIRQKFQIQVLVCAVQRGEEVIIPDGFFVIQPKDRIHITAQRNEIIKLIDKMGLTKETIKSVMILGGSRIAYYLTDILLKSGHKVKIIEQNKERCAFLSQAIPNATIVYGDGTDQDVLNEEGISKVGAFVALTGVDEENIITSMYANMMKVPKVICKINRAGFSTMATTTGVATIVTPKQIIANRVVGYIRALNSTRGSEVITLYKLVNNEVEALEFNVGAGSKCVDIPLKDLNLKKGILVCSILRDKKVIIPGANDVIKENDNIIVVTSNHLIDELDDILLS